MRRSRALARIAVLGMGVFAADPSGAPAQEAPLEGVWSGSLTVMGTDLGFSVEFVREDGGLSATMDIPMQNAFDLDLIDVRELEGRVHFELDAGPGLAVWDGLRDGDVIEGRFSQGGASGTFRIQRGDPEADAAAGKTSDADGGEEPPPYRVEDVTFTSGEVRLAGTITLPDGPGPYPGVVLLTGSGPQNRDEELFGFRIFRDIADHLTRHGIAVLRYDDRGVGESTGSVFEATSEDFAEDALAAIARLAGHPDVDPDRIGLLGHSEGALVAPLAASRSGSVAFVVLLGGTGVPGAEVIYEQSAAAARVTGIPEAAIAESRALQERLFEAVIADAGLDPFRSELEAAIRTGVERLPAEQRAAITDVDEYARSQASAQLAQLGTPWFRFFLSYDPSEALRGTRVPVLALFGELDLQVTPAQNRRPMAEALRHNPDVTMHVLPGANHLFQPARTGSPNEYPTLEKRFVPEFLDIISDWILARTTP